MKNNLILLVQCKKKNPLKIFLLMFFLSLLPYHLCAKLSQNVTHVSGMVVDMNQEPLIGVTILIKGTTIGTVTDFDGKFTLPVQNKKDVIVFSYIGYQSQEITYNGQKVLNIVMKEDQQTLDEVVVVAYGTQSKVSVTGSVSSIKTDEIKQAPAPNLVSTLTGRLPGLTTIQSSGMPGEEDFNMYLRGISTTNDQNPLILIDGVPRDNISMLDPNEIESVSVLKDASSTAVFGVRGANGVILITTKKGSSEKPSLSITAEFGRQTPTTEIHQVDSWDFAILRNQALKNDGLPAKYSERQIQLYRDGTSLLYPNTDWWDISMNSYAPQNRYNVNLSGGTDRVKYFVNVGMLNQGGIFKTESKEKLGYDPQFKLNRYNFRTNVDVKVNSWIKAGLNLAAYIDRQNKGGAKGSEDLFSANRGNPLFIYASMYRVPSIIPVKTQKGMGADYIDVPLVTDEGPSPYTSINHSGYMQYDKSSLNSSLFMDFDLSSITKGLSSKFMISFDTHAHTLTDGKKGVYTLKYDVIETKDEQGNYIDVPEYSGGDLPGHYVMEIAKRSSFDYMINMQWQVNYSRMFADKHHVSGMFLMQRDNKEAAGGSSDALLPYNVFGVSGRMAYRYNDRYLMEVNMGYNGSEQFSPEKRFGFFPAASLGWVVSNEPFWTISDAISNFKLRASYGKVGNDRIGSTRFLYLDNINMAGGGFAGSLGNGQRVTYSMVANPDITWETAYKQNYGLDLTFWNNMFKLTVDYYREKRNNILITQNTRPEVLGLTTSSLPKANLGKVENQGIEVDLSFNKRLNKDWSIYLKGNFSYNKNKVIDMDEVPLTDPERPYKYPYRDEGFSIGQPFGLLVDWESEGKGYFTSEEEIAASGLTYEGRAPRPGDFRYKDLNGDKIIDKRDEAPIGYGRIPRITYAASLNVSYKGLDVSLMFQGVAKTSTYYSSWGIFEYQAKIGSYFPLHLNAWTKERWKNGEEISYPALSTTASSSHRSNDYFIMDRSFLRLKNFEIGYTLPKAFVNKLHMQNVRAYLNGQNLFVWDKLPFDHFDPEQNGATVMPINRVINLGLNVTF